MRPMFRAVIAAGLVMPPLMAGGGAGAVQIPDEFRNLRVLPADIPRDSLVQVMRSFSFATGLRCDDCHVTGPNGSFEGARFDLDDKPLKRRARYMLSMVARLNEELREGIPDAEGAILPVECKTCHRGLAKPFLLRTELRDVLQREGVDSAVARYRELRRTSATAGAYDFDEWEMNELARETAKAGDIPAAVAFLELNLEFHPESRSIPVMLGPLYERAGRIADAITAYRRALEINPNNAAARERLRVLEGRGG